MDRLFLTQGGLTLRIRFGLFVLMLAVPMMGFSQSTLNFPKLFTAAELPVSGFAIVNPSTASATVNFKLYSAAGAVIDSKDQTYGPGTQRARSGSEIFTTSLGSGGWVQATSTTPGLQGFWLNYDGAITYIDGAEAASASLDQVIPLVAGATELNVANPGSAANSVTIKLFGEAGQLGATATQSIAANGVFQSGIGALFPTASIGSARYIRVTGTAPIASTALIRGYLVSQDTSVINGVDSTSTLTQMNFPHVVSGVGDGGNYTTELGVTNLSSTAQTVTISFTPQSGGTPTSVTRPLAANGSLRETVQSLFSSTAYLNGWLRVQATAPVAGFVAYADSVAGGVAVVSVQETPRAQLMFAHIADLAPFYTGMAVLNTNSAAATVTVTALTPDGTIIGSGSFSLAAGAKTAKLLLELVPQTQSRSSDGGFLFVSSSLPLYGIELFFNRNLSSLSNVAAGNGAGFVLPTPPLPLSLTSISPTKGSIADSVVLTGAGFSTTAANNTVLFTGAAGTVSATPTAAAATSLTAKIPAGAITGPVRVQTGSQTSGAVILQVTETPTALLPPAVVTVAAAATAAGADIYVPPPAAAGVNVTQIGISDTAGTCCSVGQSSIEIARGQTKFIAVNGTGISAANGSKLTISGTGVTISAVNISGTALFATLAVDATAPAGIRNVTITNSNLDTSVLSGGLFIR
jgi:hypothetical protein